MTRFAGARWRVPGAFLAWLLFAASFTYLLLASGALGSMGGFCASGGPYEISVECTNAIMLMPLTFLGIFLAAAIAFVFQGGFAAPLLVWGWPILFVGLGAQFFWQIQYGAVFVGILCGTLFVVMGIAPLIFEFRAGPRRIILGRSNVNDVRFTDREGAPRTFYAFGRVDPGTTTTPTAADWALSLGVTAASIALGVWLGMLAFGAAAGACRASTARCGG